MSSSSDTASRAPRQCNAEKSRLASHLRFLFQPGLLAEKTRHLFSLFFNPSSPRPAVTPAASRRGITRILLVMKAPPFPPHLFRQPVTSSSSFVFANNIFHIDHLLQEFRFLIVFFSFFSSKQHRLDLIFHVGEIVVSEAEMEGWKEFGEGDVCFFEATSIDLDSIF